jgi:hypothetical protein
VPLPIGRPTEPGRFSHAGESMKVMWPVSL